MGCWPGDSRGPRSPAPGPRPGDAAGLLAKASLNGVIFSTDEVNATFEKIRAAGAEVLWEPIDQPYGVRDCAFRDPSGNVVRFSGRPKS